MKNSYKYISSWLKESALGSDKVAKYFKTTPGSYGAHDSFIGLPVPILRKIAREFYSVPCAELQLLLASKVNEERLLALIILVNQYQKADLVVREVIYQFYLANLSAVNNWNLVDSSAHLIMGEHLIDKEKGLL
jgi:3-methyladenine DNA glycosylase AlkD